MYVPLSEALTNFSSVLGLHEEQFYRAAIAGGKTVSLTYVKFLALGPGQVGKSTFIYRLLGLMKGNIENTPKEKQPQSSTGQSDLREVCIKYINLVASATPDLSWELCGLRSQLEGLMRLSSNQTQEQDIKIAQSIASISDRNNDNSSLVLTESPLTNIAASAEKTESEKSPPKQSTNAIDSAVNTAEGAEPSTEQSVVSPTLPIAPDSMTDLINKTIVDYEKLRVVCKHSPNVTKLHMLFNIADVGGQPAFLDMLPSLTIGPAMYFLFTKLINDSGDVLSIDDLTKAQPVQYRTKHDNEPQDCENYTYTLQEVLFGALSSISCFGLSDKEVEKYVTKESEAQKTSSLAVLFGTFADKIHKEDRPKLIETESALTSIIESTDFHHKNLISFPNPLHPDQLGGKVFFQVNNKTGSDQEITRYRELIQKLVEQKFSKYNIPTAWLGLSICLKILASSRETYKVSFDDCVKLGKHFNMNREEVMVALKFLHKYIGLVMYFPNDDNLQNLVICNPQVVFSSISELTFNVYDLASQRKELTAASLQQKEFEEKGIFSPETVKYPTERSDLLSIIDLVQLLVHLNIVAKITTSDDVSTKPRVLGDADSKLQKSDENILSCVETRDPLVCTKYFFPAILKMTDKFDVRGGTEEILPEPLCIRFENGYLPMGFTCALSARLISEQNFELSPDEPILYKNKISFRFVGQFNVTMISLPLHCEFHVTRHYGNIEFYNQGCCPKIVNILRKAADDVLKSMQKTYLSKNNYDIAFKCPLAKHQNVKFGHEPLARLVYTDSFQTQLKQIECLECGTTITDVKPEMDVWFGEVRTAFNSMSRISK